MQFIRILQRNKLVKNLSWIFFGSVIHAVFSFLLSVVAARSFSTTDYGILSYALSLTTLFSSLCILGLNVIITKEIADDEENVGNILSSGIVLRLIAAVIAIALMFIYLFIKGNKDASTLIISIYSLSIVFAAFDLFMYWFRYEYKSNVAAILKLVAFLISAVIKIIAILMNSIIVFAIGAITESLIYGVLLISRYIKERGFDLIPSFERGKRLFTTAIPFIFSSVLVAIYSQTDRVMLEAMVGYESVAQYSVCYTLANVIAVALSSLSEAFRPEILKARTADPEKYTGLYKQLYGLTFWISAIYGLFVTVFSKYILSIIYGEKYLPAQTALSLIVWYSSFSYFGAVHNIYMVAENKTKWVQVLTLIGAFSNIIINWILIPKMGAAGAALASLLTQFIANFAVPLIIPQLRPMAMLTVKGIFSVKTIVKGSRT